MIFADSIEFTNYIISLAEHQGSTVLDVLSEMIRTEQIEVETVQEMMTPLLYQKLYENFKDLHYFKNEDGSLVDLLTLPP